MKCSWVALTLSPLYPDRTVFCPASWPLIKISPLASARTRPCSPSIRVWPMAGPGGSGLR